MTLLREFCRDGKLKEVRRLIASCPDSVFEVDKDGITALWNAVMHGHTLIVEALLEAAGKDFQKNLVFQRASESFSCLEFALIQKNMDIARLLVKAGGEELVHRHSHEGTCLHKACRFGDISIVREILRIGGKSLVYKTDKEGASALHIASQEGNLDMVRALVKVGGRDLLLQATIPTSSTGEGQTCLHCACMRGHVAVVRELLAAGGQELVAIAGSDACSCLHLACRNQHARVVQELLSGGGRAVRDLLLLRSYGYNPLLIACHRCNRATVRALLSAGGDLTSLSEFGETVLHCASAAGRADNVRELLDAGGATAAALLPVRAASGLTCLDEACVRGHLEVVKLLLAAGGRPLALLAGPEGMTCLHRACEGGFVSVVEQLVGVGGEELMLARRSNGATCLHSVCAAGASEARGDAVEAL